MGDRVWLEHIAHALKGVSATVGARKLADYAEKIEKQAHDSGELNLLSELLDTTASELSRIVASIEIMLAPAVVCDLTDKSPGADVGSEQLAPLFNKSIAFLLTFDTAVEKVVEEMRPLARTTVRKEKIDALQSALSAYDFDHCLVILRLWAQEEGIELESG